MSMVPWVAGDPGVVSVIERDHPVVRRVVGFERHDVEHDVHWIELVIDGSEAAHEYRVAACESYDRLTRRMIETSPAREGPECRLRLRDVEEVDGVVYVAVLPFSKDGEAGPCHFWVGWLRPGLRIHEQTDHRGQPAPFPDPRVDGFGPP